MADHVGDRRVAVADEKIEPAVVVEIPEEACRRMMTGRAGDAAFRGDFMEPAVGPIVVEPARPVPARNEQVGPAVAVVVAPGRVDCAMLAGDTEPLRRHSETFRRAGCGTDDCGSAGRARSMPGRASR